MELAKAGWIRKSAGTWQITDSGRSALAGLSDPVALHEAAMGRRDPRITPAVPESVGDIFAGCFLSIAGALVGAIIGTIVSLVRMLPDLSLALLGGLVAGFVGGAVLGLLASFGIAGVVRHFGRHAEDIWVIATALASAVFGAVTAFLVIAGITGR